MALTKSNAELLISILKQWDLLDEGVCITFQRKKHRGFSTFFSFRKGLCYCHDIRGLFEAIGISCNTSDWRLFINSSSKSLKAVLLHNTKQGPLHSFGSFSADERELRERQNAAKRSPV